MEGMQLESSGAGTAPASEESRVCLPVAGRAPEPSDARIRTRVISPHSGVALPPWSAGFAFLIVADFSALFAEFCKKRFPLLWHGFTAAATTTSTL
jgi:hypothetical protein